MTTPKYVPPTYYPISPKPPELPKPITAPPGYYIDNNGNVMPMQPALPKTPTEPTVPPGYYMDNLGNLKLMAGYYDNGSGIGQPIPPVLPPQIPPQPTIDPSVGSDTYPQPPRSNPQNLQTDDIRSFVNANIGDPALIASAMRQYGLNATDVAQAMGVDPNVVTSYLSNGVPPPQDIGGIPGPTVSPPNPPTPPTPNPPTPQTNPGLPGVVPYQLPDGSTIMIPAGTLGSGVPTVAPDTNTPNYSNDSLPRTPEIQNPPSPNVAAPQPAISASDIQSFVNANIGNPATIANAMQQYNVSANDIASAMGVDPSVVNSYLSNTGS